METQGERVNVMDKFTEARTVDNNPEGRTTGRQLRHTCEDSCLACSLENAKKVERDARLVGQLQPRNAPDRHNLVGRLQPPPPRDSVVDFDFDLLYEDNKHFLSPRMPESAAVVPPPTRKPQTDVLAAPHGWVWPERDPTLGLRAPPTQFPEQDPRDYGEDACDYLIPMGGGQTANLDWDVGERVGERNLNESAGAHVGACAGERGVQVGECTGGEPQCQVVALHAVSFALIAEMRLAIGSVRKIYWRETWVNFYLQKRLPESPNFRDVYTMSPVHLWDEDGSVQAHVCAVDCFLCKRNVQAVQQMAASPQDMSYYGNWYNCDCCGEYFHRSCVLPVWRVDSVCPSCNCAVLVPHYGLLQNYAPPNDAVKAEQALHVAGLLHDATTWAGIENADYDGTAYSIKYAYPDLDNHPG